MVPGLGGERAVTWEKGNDPLLGVLLSSLDRELVKNLHLWKREKNDFRKGEPH